MAVFRLKALLVLAGCGIFLGGCEAALSLAGTAVYEKYNKEDVNLNEKSYAATDYLIQQSNTYYDRFSPIKIMALTDFERPSLSSKFGRTIGNQVGSRFAQLGYNVDLSDVPLRDGDASLLGREDLKVKAKPKIIVTGTYRRDGSDMAVNLRVMDAESGYTITTFEYFINYDSNIRRMAEPEISIVRVPR